MRTANERMSAGYQSLTEREKQTLRLIVRGHDAKSMARHLGLSVHTVNERLRDARRKLEVPSSRAAARLLFETEGDDPQYLVDREIGEADAGANVELPAPTDPNRELKRLRTGVIAGVITMAIFLIVLGASLLADSGPPSAATSASSPAVATVSPAVIESPAVRAARDWLVLGDQGRWKDGWLATASSFRKANTVERWADAAIKVRVPMGALISRTALSQESVPAPPAGVEVVKFRSNFANKAEVIETVSLAREGAEWRVVGIYVD